MISRLQALVASTNRLNSEITSKLETARAESAELRKNAGQLSDTVEELSQKIDADAVNHSLVVDAFQKEITQRNDALTNLLQLYNDLRIKSKSLEIELESGEVLQGKICLLDHLNQLVNEKASLEIVLSEKISIIADLESKLERKALEIEMLNISFSNQEKLSKRKEMSRDLKECIKTQDIQLSKFLDPVTFDFSEFSSRLKQISNS